MSTFMTRNKQRQKCRWDTQDPHKQKRSLNKMSFYSCYIKGNMQNSHVQTSFHLITLSSSYCLKLVSHIEMSNSTIFTAFIGFHKATVKFVRRYYFQRAASEASASPSRLQSNTSWETFTLNPEIQMEIYTHMNIHHLNPRALHLQVRNARAVTLRCAERYFKLKTKSDKRQAAKCTALY